ncbi:MAG: hypothetical protein DSZ03_04755 [Sulfurimonas sp.]|nr:MAG: hypothetical protein DSZ03_04755 [Sulfurimonas sp.]
MFGCKLKAKEKVLLGVFIFFLVIISIAAGNYYRSLSVLFGAFVFGMVVAIMALRLECQDRENDR